MRVARLRLGRRASEYLPAGDNMTSGSARPTLRCSFRRVICVKWKLLPLLLLTLPLVATLTAQTSSGPPRGSLVVAGGIIQGSFIVRGRPDKPLLMAKGHTRGFGFLKGVVVDPHLTEQKRESELVNVMDAHPELLGIGMDENAAIVVRGDGFKVEGS